MKQLKLLFTVLFLAVLGLGNVWGADVTLTFSAQGYTNEQVVTSGTIDENTSWSATKGGTNDPKYYNTGSGLRVYNGGTFAVTSTKTIASITLTFSGTGYTFSASNTTTPQTVTPNATSYSWDVSRTCRLQKVEVTYAAGGDQTAVSVDVDNTQSIVIGATLNVADLFTVTTDGYDGTLSYAIKNDANKDNATLVGTTLTGVSAGTVTVVASAAATGSFAAVNKEATVTVTEPPFEGTIVTMKAANDADIKFVTGSSAAASAVWANSTPLSAKGITLSGAVTSGTNYSYYDGSVVRFYTNNNLVITPATGVTIVKVEIIRQTTTGSNTGTINCSGLTAADANTTTNTNVYTGTATSAVTFTATAQARFTAINVYYTGTPTEVYFSSIAVKTAPTKVEYTEGDFFDPAGLVITKIMSDETTEDVEYAGNESDFTFSPALDAALKTTDAKVTITYAGKPVDQTITVAAAPEVGVSFEKELTAYTDWTFNGIVSQATEITAHSGSYCGKTSGANTAYIQTNSKVNPASLSCFVSKTTNNTTASTWSIQTSTDKSNWTTVATQSATSMSKGTWVELSADLSAYSNVYVRVYYGSNSAVRAIDDIVLTTRELAHSNVSFAQPAHGTVSASATENVEEGTQVTLTYTPADGYKLTAFDAYKTGDEATKVTVTDGKFTMPAYDVTATATIEVAKVFDGEELTLSGTYPTEFWKGDAFSHDGMTVTAHFNTGDETVTGVFSGYDMTTAGVQTVTVTFTEGGVSQTAIYDITVKTIANTQETAYTPAQAKALYDAGNDLSTPVYVKGIVSEMVSTSLPTSGYLNFYITEDGEAEGLKFEFYKTYKAAGKVQWTSVDDVQVGDEVIGFGKLAYYAAGTVYEFDGNTESYVVSLNRPVVLKSIELNTDNVKKTYKIGSDDVFSAEGLVVTAHYNVSTNDKEIDLANVSFSGYDMTVANTYTVTVSYTENEVTKTATYQIQVKPDCETLATITMGAAENGTFDLSVKGEQCAETAISTVLTATPAEHYHLASVTATNGTVGIIEGNTCTISEITADAEITAVFEEDAKGTATFVAGAAEATGDAPAAIVKYVGETLTIPANTFALLGGYKFAGWKYNETIYQKGDEFTVAGDAEFVAQWEALPVWATTYTSNVTVGTDAVMIAGTSYEAKKTGTSSAAGKTTVTVPAGATALHFHAAAWNDEVVTLKVSNGATELGSFALLKDGGMRSNSPFTLQNDPAQEYYMVALEGIVAETTITFEANTSATSGKRFAIYGVNVEKVDIELVSVAISGTATKTEYFAGDVFDPAGLVVTGTYSLGEPQEITEGIDWTFTPATLAVGTTSVSVVATVGGKSSEAFVVNDLTVTKAPLIANWVANAQGYANGDAIEGSAIKHETTTVATVTFNDGTNESNAPKYYTTGESVRAYGGNNFVISALKGFTMTKIVPSFGTGDGSNAITASVGTYADGEWNGSATEVTFTIGGTSGHRRIAGITVYYEGELATPTGIVLNTETVKKEFAFGEEFNSKNLVVKAVYSDESEEDITLAAEVVAPDMSTSGEKTVKVKYLTFSETYNITVADPEADETVDLPAGTKYGTFCYEHGFRSWKGASFYEVAYAPSSALIYFDEVKDVLVPGRPYLYVVEDGAEKIELFYSDADPAAEAATYRAMTGSFENIPAAAPSTIAGKIIVYNNNLYTCGDWCGLNAHRAYIDIDAAQELEDPYAGMSNAPRRVVLGSQVTTSIETLNGENDSIRKVMIDGNIYIFRGAQLFNVQGQLVK